MNLATDFVPQIRPASQAELIQKSQNIVRSMGQLRGRDLIYPMFPTGRGQGCFIEMEDGSVKMDLICGIGVHLFGYRYPELQRELERAATCVPAMQGTLMPGHEQHRLMAHMIEGAAQPANAKKQSQMHFASGWVTSCGTMANELALKAIRQKKFPAYKIIGLHNCFSGRSTTMQELTDEPKYREGQPTFDQFLHVNYFDPRLSLEDNITRTKTQIDIFLSREPGKIAGFVAEPVPGEGYGFQLAPKEWWRAILEFVRSQGLAVWMDEIQTFGRCGELYASQKLEFADLVDVVTVAKPIQCGMALWTKEYQPKPGLIAGTFSAATTSLAVGAKTIELLRTNNYLGPKGKIAAFETMVRKDFEKRKSKHLKGIRLIGGMVAFEILDGKAETLKNFLLKLYENGVIGFSAGKDPVVLRFLPPIGVIEPAQWTLAMDIVENTLNDFAAANKAGSQK